VELVKLKQINLTGTLMITADCYGAIPTKAYSSKMKDGQKSRDIFESVKSGGANSDVRSACLVCEYPSVENSDINMDFLGSDLLKELMLEANTEAGEKALTQLGLESGEAPKNREEALKQLIEGRLQAKMKMAQHIAEDVAGIDKLLSLLATCVNCHNCMRACPICYCKECFFDSAVFEAEPQKYLNRAQKKGALRMPSDTLLFHLGRLNHMSSSCVACGCCEEACPNGVELLKVFKIVGDEVQKVFEYVPGRSLEEELPLSTFREDELEPR